MLSLSLSVCAMHACDGIRIYVIGPSSFYNVYTCIVVQMLWIQSGNVVSLIYSMLYCAIGLEISETTTTTNNQKALYVLKKGIVWLCNRQLARQFGKEFNEMLNKNEIKFQENRQKGTAPKPFPVYDALNCIEKKSFSFIFYMQSLWKKHMGVRVCVRVCVCTREIVLNNCYSFINETVFFPRIILLVIGSLYTVNYHTLPRMHHVWVAYRKFWEIVCGFFLSMSIDFFFLRSAIFSFTEKCLH